MNCKCEKPTQLLTVHEDMNTGICYTAYWCKNCGMTIYNHVWDNPGKLYVAADGTVIDERKDAKNAMKVLAVFAGEYEDRRLVGVFSEKNKEQAEQLATLVGDYEFLDITRLILDNDVQLLKDPNIDCYRVKYNQCQPISATPGQWYYYNNSFVGKNSFDVHVLATSEEEAITKAKEIYNKQ